MPAPKATGAMSMSAVKFSGNQTLSATTACCCTFRQVSTLTAAGVNAVLVAPQFAVNAADSSAGKFWEPNGFRRFLDEAAVKLARMYGDPRSAFTFARMPIIIVAYSGGFGPTLSVLDRGGVRSRVRGLVLLDALYDGIDKFADWVAD